MIELLDDSLLFSFPEVHPQARLRLTFQRTLRIPDDGRTYPLPPGLGAFPLRHVDDFAAGAPGSWSAHGGVMLPMYQAEALWLHFGGHGGRHLFSPYPFAVKVAAGKINAVTGQAWSNDLHSNPQDYLVAPDQPWLDGFVVQKEVIRQFVAMPLGGGYTAEEQLTGAVEHGGLQILVHPMKRECYERRFSRRRTEGIMLETGAFAVQSLDLSAGMGLAPGGRMKQEIYVDPYGPDEWEQSARSRCFVHLLNSLLWEAVTGAKPPSPPPVAATYTKHGLPWFDYYAEGRNAVDGAEALARLRSVIELSRQKGEPALPENTSVQDARVVNLRRQSPTHVRDGAF